MQASTSVWGFYRTHLCVGLLMSNISRERIFPCSICIIFTFEWVCSCTVCPEKKYSHAVSVQYLPLNGSVLVQDVQSELIQRAVG